LRLRGRITHDQGYFPEAAELLSDAACRLERIDRDLATETHFESLVAAIWASGPDGPELIRKSAEAALAGPSRHGCARTAELMVEAMAIGATKGHHAAAPAMELALKTARHAASARVGTDGPLWPVVSRTAGILALEAWDFDAGLSLAEERVAVARESGALIELQFALQMLANYVCLTGDMPRAIDLVEEERQLSLATRMDTSLHSDVMMAALRGESRRVLELVQPLRELAAGNSQGRMVAWSDYVSSFQHNALRQHRQALECAKRVMEWGVVGYQTLAAPELAEAASRQGDDAALADVASWMRARAEATPTLWAAGVSALVAALAADRADDAEGHYQMSVDLLTKTPLRMASARARLLYGEWLRRSGRKADALVQLTQAHDALRGMGLRTLSDRARREMSATTRRRVRTQLDDPTAELTGQELQVAQYVQAGLTNREISVRLYLSPRTVEWHLGNVFDKLGISSRRQLRDADLAPHTAG
jgi:DNA-binding CsgD family transcriptional regulator